MALNEKQLREIISLLPDPVFILSESGKYVDFLGGEDQHTYHNGHPLVGRSLYDALSKEKADWFMVQILDVLNNQGVRVVEYDLAASDVDGIEGDSGPSGVLHFEGKVCPLSMIYGGERAVLWLTRNVTKRYQMECLLRMQSETDALTGLFNRRRFMDALQLETSTARMVRRDTCLLLLDLDHFKRINDNFGHQAGDKVLQGLGQLVSQILREDDLFARVGGEEFAVLLPRMNLKHARDIAERIRETIATHSVTYRGFELFVTVSVGVTSVFQGDDAETVYARADDALYEAKNSGRNKVVAQQPETQLQSVEKRKKKTLKAQKTKRKPNQKKEAVPC